MDDLDQGKTAWKRSRGAARRGRDRRNRRRIPDGFCGLWPVFAVLAVSKTAVQDIWGLPADLRTMSLLADGLLRQVRADSRAGLVQDWVMRYGLAAVGDEPTR